MIILGKYWWFFLPGLLLGLYAQFKLTANYNHYLQVPSESGLTGAQAAREMLDSAGLTEVPINEVGGHLTDHYDPTQKALFLSSENFHGNSLSAIGVAAHEAGHALQHKAAYAPLEVRSALVPITQFASNGASILFFIGLFMSIAKLAFAGVIIFAIITLFQLVTLPVEYDASARAKEQLERLGLISRDERRGIAKVLNAAALTYVAAMVQSLFTLLQFVLILRDSERRD
ncbi:MAG TPA: zinc metallopeptidase [Verrucomicrobiae bacterium]|nr:zinc metallopeptidase [Verrucomicrobiae bacterium]